MSSGTQLRGTNAYHIGQISSSLIIEVKQGRAQYLKGELKYCRPIRQLN